MLLNNFARAIISGLIFLPLVSFAQTSPNDNSPKSDYKMPTGEQPTFGKKYYGDLPSASSYIEFNPLMLFRRQLQAGFEVKSIEKLTLGSDLEYRYAEIYEGEQTSAKLTYIGLSPKARFYPFELLTGAFVGVKVGLGQLSTKVEGNALKSTSIMVKQEDAKFLVSPSIHGGYRFLTDGGFTVALYLGGGLNFPNAKFIANDDDKAAVNSPDEWTTAYKKLTDDSKFYVDIGMTVGVGL